jgi:hypothetical protein
MDTETRSSLNSKSFLYTIRPMHLSDEPKKFRCNANVAFVFVNRNVFSFFLNMSTFFSFKFFQVGNNQYLCSRLDF